MRFRCPKCGEAVESATLASGERVLCAGCKTRLKLPAGPETVEDLPAPPEPQFVSDPFPPAPPTYPVAPADAFDFTRERAGHVQADREHRRRPGLEDRGGNPFGTAGFALAVTALVMLLSGAAFSRELKVYAWLMGVFGLPVVLASLPCSIVGCLRAGAPRLLAGIGVGLGVFLLIVGYPGLFLILTNSK